jgi:hypothetical protein
MTSSDSARAGRRAWVGANLRGGVGSPAYALALKLALRKDRNQPLCQKREAFHHDR